jgi:hypothetical protein
MFSNEAVDPRRDDGQRYRTELEHSIVESADVEFETRSFPNSLVATLAILPSMSLIPTAPFSRLHFAESSGSAAHLISEIPSSCRYLNVES